MALFLPSLGLVIGLISLLAAVRLVQEQARSIVMVELPVDRHSDRWGATTPR